jgi:hypothetical protein
MQADLIPPPSSPCRLVDVEKIFDATVNSIRTAMAARRPEHNVNYDNEGDE